VRATETTNTHTNTHTHKHTHTPVMHCTPKHTHHSTSGTTSGTSSSSSSSSLCVPSPAGVPSLDTDLACEKSPGFCAEGELSDVRSLHPLLYVQFHTGTDKHAAHADTDLACEKSPGFCAEGELRCQTCAPYTHYSTSNSTLAPISTPHIQTLTWPVKNHQGFARRVN